MHSGTHRRRGRIETAGLGLGRGPLGLQHHRCRLHRLGKDPEGKLLPGHRDLAAEQRGGRLDVAARNAGHGLQVSLQPCIACEPPQAMGCTINKTRQTSAMITCTLQLKVSSPSEPPDGSFATDCRRSRPSASERSTHSRRSGSPAAPKTGGSVEAASVLPPCLETPKSGEIGRT